MAARLVHWIIVVVAASFMLGSAAPASAQSRLAAFLEQATPQEFFAQPKSERTRQFLDQVLDR